MLRRNVSCTNSWLSTSYHYIDGTGMNAKKENFSPKDAERTGRPRISVKKENVTDSRKMLNIQPSWGNLRFECTGKFLKIFCRCYNILVNGFHIAQVKSRKLDLWNYAEKRRNFLIMENFRVRQHNETWLTTTMYRHQ